MELQEKLANQPKARKIFTGNITGITGIHGMFSQVETKVEVEAPPVQCGPDDLLQYFNTNLDMWKQGLWRHQSRRVKNPCQ